ncbi:MAG: nuclear transport factor 2 family protein [Ginsengibacter sp.]
MKKIFVTAALFFLGLTAFCQQEENGTIYIKHPYIDVVNNSNKAYDSQDWASIKGYYADTAKWWISGLEKFIAIDDAIKSWKGDFEHFTDIKQIPVGYPDYLQYKKDDSKVVQSWWTWTGKSKKTGKVVKVQMVMFDDFNNDGKIVREYIYGDFSKAQE